MSSHLNEEEFAACALGDEVAPEIEARRGAHLATCEACRAEVASFAASVESFNAASLAWSESQPVQTLRPLVQARKSHTTRTIASWGLAGAVAGCLAVVSVISVGSHRGASRGSQVLQVIGQVEDSPAQIERDNKLLLAVAEATSTRAESPLQAYGLEAPVPAPARAPQPRNDND